MILGDSDIRFLLRSGAIIVTPEPKDQDFQPASLEMHLEGDYLLDPGQFELANTMQTITLANSIAAQLTGKSSLGRLGLDIHATAGFIDPGFTGQIVLELYNKSQQPIVLRDGQAIGQLVFHRLLTSAVRPYGHPGLGSHYQYQVGVTPSHLS